MDSIRWHNIIEGEEKLYAEFYLEYYKKLYNYGRKFTEDVTLIEDSIQEFFLDLWKRRNQLQNIASPNSYCFSAFRFILLKKLKQTHQSLSNTEVEDTYEFSVEQSIIEQETDTMLQHQLQSALLALTSRQKEAIFLRFYEGLSYDEVASILNISTKATYKIIARALQTLRDTLTLALIPLFIALFRPA